MDNTPSAPPSMFDVPQGSNAVTNQGQSRVALKLPTSSGFWPGVIAAGKSIYVPRIGNQFEVVVSTAEVWIRPQGGEYSMFVQGLGLHVPEGFTFLEIENRTAYPVVVLLFIGAGDLINRTLILSSAVNKAVTYPTYPVPNVASTINIPDLSAQKFTDINGGKWIAIRRVTIEIWNSTASTVYLLQKRGATSSADPSVAFILPMTGMRHDAGGDYTIVSGGVLPLIVNEIYEAIADV